MNDKKKGMEIDKNEVYVSDMFASDGIEVPDSLSRENIASMLADADAGKAATEVAEPVRKTVKKHSWRRPLGWIAAVAACLLLVVISAINSGEKISSDLLTFSSYDEIYSKIDEITEAHNQMLYDDGLYYDEDAEIEGSADGSADGGTAREYAASPGEGIIVQKNYSLGAAKNGAASNSAAKNGAAKGAPGEAAPTTGNTASGEEHSETYIQVEGVDEADKVKVDGKYIYFIDSTGGKVLIYEAGNGKPSRVSEIAVSGEEGLEAIFLSGDRLTLISSVYGYERDTETAAKVYDVSDRAHPKKTAEYIQSGMPVSQRMVGDILYLVTDKYAYDRMIPYCGARNDTEELAVKDICCVPSPSSAEYTVIGAVDTASGKELSHVTKAVLGGSQDIYANGENLYVAGTTYINSKPKKTPPVRNIILPYYGHAATMIVKVRMANGDIRITDSAVVKGTIDDQFSMDERNGKFRIATTSVTDDGDDVNNLFVLDKHLKELGHVSGFARGESIKAVRYVKNKAYVITYEQTDPLFVIDLTDSKAPKIEGEVKIDGFSTLLIPLSEDRLLGIGYATRQVESWQETSGLKFALFDISDPAKPKVVTSKTKEDIFSEVQEDHRALVQLGSGEEARFILPCRKEYEAFAIDYEDGNYEEYEEKGPLGGVLTITASDDRIDEQSYDEVKDPVERCPVIGDHIYAITDTDEVTAVKLPE